MRKLLTLAVVLTLTGCMTQRDDQYQRAAYKSELDTCLKRQHYYNVTLTPAEYAETERYRSKIDPDLDDTNAIQAVYDKKKAAIMLACDKNAEQSGLRARGGPAVSLPVVFVAPLY